MGLSHTDSLIKLGIFDKEEIILILFAPKYKNSNFFKLLVRGSIFVILLFNRLKIFKLSIFEIGFTSSIPESVIDNAIIIPFTLFSTYAFLGK